MSPRATLVSAIKGITTHFAFLSKREKADECALVDSGATKNFMDHSMIRRLGIGTRKLPTPRRIFNVDGMENITGRLTEFCTLRVRKGDKNRLQTFYITTLGMDRAILGYPWLRTFNPQINWEEGKILGLEIQIETCGLGKQRKEVLVLRYRAWTAAMFLFFYFMFHPFLPTSPAVPVHDPSGQHVIQHHMTDRLGHLPAARVDACPALTILLYPHLRLLMDHYG